MVKTYRCSIGNSGANQDGNVFIYLSGSAPGTGDTIANYYIAAPSVKKEMLATALVAMTNRRLVLATLDTPTPIGGLLK
jgi:hypothetical protein